MVPVFAKGMYCLCMSVVIVSGCGQTMEDSKDTFVLKMDGYPVGREEFCWFMQQQRASVFQSVAAEYHLESDENFWDQKCGGTTPKNILQQKTIEKIIREKTQQMLFKELGLIEDIRYTVFLEDLEKLNKERKRAVEQGKVIYGPIQYTSLQYYGHWMASLQIQAKDILRKERFDMTESKLQDYYNCNKEQFKNAKSFTLEALVILRESIADSPDSNSPITSIADDFFLKSQQGRPLQEISQENTDPKTFIVQYKKLDRIDETRLNELFPDEGHFKQIRSLVPGRIIRLSVADDQMWIVKCIALIPSGYQPYEHIRTMVADRYADTEYDRWIRTRVQKVQIKVNQELLNKIELP